MDRVRFATAWLAACVSALPVAAAPAPVLDLTAAGTYLSHVSRGLEAYGAYRQVARHVMATESEERVMVAIAERASSGERGFRESNSVVNGAILDGGRYDMVGRNLIFDGSGTTPVCHVLPDDALQDGHFPPLTTGVSDATGFLTATLVEAGVVVHGILTDHYRLEPPPMPAFDTMSGDVWLARDDRVIVRYEVETTQRDTTFTWTYDLEALGTLETLTLPEACEGE
jgi:hypothetical protein